jgi:pimeloyl-ACP methyl ester carboxylesterase
MATTWPASSAPSCTPGSKTGYLHQLLAGLVWTSLFALPAIRQPTLIVAGTGDPIVPIANARIMTRLLPHASLHRHPGGPSTWSLMRASALR